MPEPRNLSPRAWLIFGFAALFLFQLLSTVLCFKTPAELFRPEPIINIDWCSQYYWSFAARRFFENSHRLWGFDPYYMAGYPLDFIFNSSLPVQVANIIFKPLPLGLVIKWFFLITFMLAPLNFYAAARNFGLDKAAALLASALGISYFWLGEDALFGNWGMLSGAFLLNFFLLAAGALYRYLLMPDRKSFARFALLLALAVLIHKTFVVLVFLPAAVLLLIFARRISAKSWFSLFSAGIFAYLVNSFWILPMLRFLPNKIEDPNTTFFQNTILLRFLADLIPVSPLLPGVVIGRLLIFIPGIWGIFCLRKNQQTRSLFWFLMTCYLCFFAFVYFGSFLEILRHLQPYRYLSAMFFLLTPSAGFALQKLVQSLRPRSPFLAKLMPAVFALLLLAIQFVPSFRLFYVVSPLTSVWPDKVQNLQTWIEKNTDQNARIMAEDINSWEGRLAPYGSSKFVGLLPALVPRYLVGGPLPNAFIRHHYASFHDGYFLNQPIAQYNDQELKEKIVLYNIRWAFSWNGNSQKRLKNFPLAKSKAKFDDIEVFEFDIEPGWFLMGSGALRADYDKIELKNLKPEKGKVILKMHWLYGFKPRPVCKMFRYYAGGDPIGFIGLLNPAPEVVLEYER